MSTQTWSETLEHTEALVYTPQEFAAAHRMSRAGLYDAWKKGIGPRFFNVGSKVLITREAAAEWRAEREKATSKVKQTEAA